VLRFGKVVRDVQGPRRDGSSDANSQEFEAEDGVDPETVDLAAFLNTFPATEDRATVAILRKFFSLRRFGDV